MIESSVEEVEKLMAQRITDAKGTNDVRGTSMFAHREAFAISEGAFRKILYVAGVSVFILLIAIFLSLVVASYPSIKRLGIGFLYGKTWDPVASEFGALPFLVGTIATSFLALLISVFFSVPIAIFLGEYYPEGTAANVIKTVIELLAGIPSVIYGFWGLFFLVPAVRWVETKLGVAPYGVGILTSSLILAVMIVPYAASLGREVIALVPYDLKEAALSLGATRFEVIRKVVLPYARSGIFAGIMLSLGRALGETMAVTMVIGNSNFLPTSIFAPSNTMASVIANEFTEATGALYLSTLIQIGLLLFIVTTIINVIGKIIISKLSTEV
jgi:phosphate transport system permease protein